MGDVITPNMTKSKFDCYIGRFNIQKTDPLPNDTDQILPVTADLEQTSRLDFSRAADIRHDVPSRVVEHSQHVVPSVPPSVPAIEYLPSPEEEEDINKLQQEVDESKTVRPKELGQNLSLPPVKHNKSKINNKKPKEKIKKQSPKKKENLEPN